jgi:uncharacterized protein (TIGR00369 family)
MSEKTSTIHEIEEGLERKAEILTGRAGKSLSHALDFEFLSFKRQEVKIRMPVSDKTRQPFGILHGGASVALAETAASIGAWLNIDDQKYSAVGLEINANHVRGVRDGYVTATAVPLHLGQRTHLWEIEICDQAGKLVCMSRCTMMIVASS